jgi:hypothetical protein
MLSSTWEDDMPTDSLLVSIAVCSIFVIFAVVLAVVDHRTTNRRRESIATRAAEATDPARRKAA